MILGSVILAGGRSRRMGRAKESLPFGDSTMLGHTVDTLLGCTFPVIVVARDPGQELPPVTLEAQVVYDDRADEGPLTGMLAGIRAARADCEAVFVTGCDTPFLGARSVDWLARELGEHEVLMARLDDRLQPLGAIYRTSILPVIEKLIDEGTHTPRTLAESCKSRILTSADVDAHDPNRDFLRNINSPEDYAAALTRLESTAG